jgi:hypothetical protein
MLKKVAAPGETVASFARRTGQVDKFARRGVEVRGADGWKRVGMEYRMRDGDTVRAVEPADLQDDPLGLVSLLQSFVRRQRR